MRVLVVHNHYRQFGGEDAVVSLECSLHKEYGQEIYVYERSNEEIDPMPWWQRGRAVGGMYWSQRTFEEVKVIIRDFKPDIAHVYNTHFMVTPAVYYACKESGVPVVQSLYNFRLVCANAVLLRGSQHCEECLQRSRWRSVWYKCYRHSSILTACVVRSQNFHWRKGTWTKMVDAYVVANAYSREKFMQAGIPREKFFIKPHFVHPDPGRRTKKGQYALFVGRLSEEKGAKFLVEAWEELPEIPLKVIGTGPLLDYLRKYVSEKRMEHVAILGYQPDEEFFRYLRTAQFLVLPSICHDNSPRAVLEAFAFGVPVLASSLEGVGEMVKDKTTGRVFLNGQARDLAEKARWLAGDESRLAAMGQAARAEYEQKYTAEKNYEVLTAVYRKILDPAAAKSLAGSGVYIHDG